MPRCDHQERQPGIVETFPVVNLIPFTLLFAWGSLTAEVIDYPPTEAGVSFSTIQTLAAGLPTAELFYAQEPQQYGELWLPVGSGPFPVVVFIHGGCWLNTFDITHTHAASTALTYAGYAVWSLEYRRIGDPGGGWPGTFDDISRGVDHLLALAARYPVDVSQVYLVGHSAGGHLALWAAGREVLPGKNTVTIAAVITLAGITDLESFAAGKSSCQRAVVQLMGGPPARWPDRYQQASPMYRLPANVPTTLIQGTSDTIVPMSQAEAYYESARLNEGGGRIKLRRVAGAGHFDLIHPGTEAWQQLLEALTE